MKHVLMVDDDVTFFEMIENVSKDIKFYYAENKAQMNQFLESKKVDLILMDWELGRESGIRLVKELKSEQETLVIPVIMLTGKTTQEDIIEALNNGADDFIAKPFELSHLLAKINANIRRSIQLSKKEMHTIKGFTFNENELTICFKQTKIQLCRKEFTLIRAMASNSDKVFSREELNELTNGKGVFVSDRTIDTFVAYIRKKIPEVNLIQTVPTKGYKFNSKLLD